MMAAAITSNPPAITFDLLIICPFPSVARSPALGPKPVEHNSARRGLASPLHFAVLTYGVGNKQGPRSSGGAHFKRVSEGCLVPATTTLHAENESRGVPAPPRRTIEPHAAAIAELGELHERILCRRSYAMRPDRDCRCRARCRRKHEQRPGYKRGFVDHSLHPPWLMPPTTPTR